ncbi:hypothetical protein CA951_41710 [Rhodococcus sp. NCIMB 12038]|nr:hypothetical protein CA951_41710 [Rhodococcus sp. NCIMB 12038]
MERLSRSVETTGDRQSGFEFNLCHALFHKTFTHLWFEAAMAAVPENREDSTAEAADPIADLRKK